MLVKRNKSDVSTPLKKTKTVSRKKNWLPPVRVFLGRQPFPKQLFNTLRYADVVNAAVTSGVGVTYQFSCNSLYDPNASGVGHQPLYFDQLIAIYDHYTVLRSRVKLTPTALTNLTGALVCAAWIDDDTSASTDIVRNMERIGAKTYVFQPGAASAKYPSIYMSWSATEAFGPNPQANDSLQGTSGASPTEQQYFTMNIAENLASASTTPQWVVEIEYDVVWDEFVTISGS